MSNATGRGRCPHRHRLTPGSPDTHYTNPLTPERPFATLLCMSVATIRTLSAALHSATAALVRALVPFLSREDWKQDGVSSPEHWLALNVGFDFHQARRLIELARALPAI